MLMLIFYVIWGSHGGDDVDIGLVGCYVLWTFK
jgi:hypothetical protein